MLVLANFIKAGPLNDAVYDLLFHTVLELINLAMLTADKGIHFSWPKYNAAKI